MRLPAALRNALSLPLRRLAVPVLSGPNAGRLWSLASSGRGAVTGRYHADRFAAIDKLLEPQDTVWDVGAHKGYATLIAAKRTAGTGNVVAFEPAALNCWSLERHLRWNRTANVRVIDCALGERDGTDRFGGRGSSIAYRLGTGTETVTVRSADSLVRNGELARPTFLKIDVEGAETAVLRGAASVLRDDTLIFLSVHSAALFRDCSELLEAAGMRILLSPEIARARSRADGEWRGDPDLIAVGRTRFNRLPSLPRFTALPAPQTPVSAQVNHDTAT